MARVMVHCDEALASDLVTYLNGIQQVNFDAVRIDPNKEQAQQILDYLKGLLEDARIAGEITDLDSIVDCLYNNVPELLDYIAEVHR